MGKNLTKALRVVFNDGTPSKCIEISKYTQILKPLQHVMLHIDKMEDGKLRLIVGIDFVENFNTIDKIEIVRE